MPEIHNIHHSKSVSINVVEILVIEKICSCRDWLIFYKLLDRIRRGVIPAQEFRAGPGMLVYHRLENGRLVLAALRALGNTRTSTVQYV